MRIIWDESNNRFEVEYKLEDVQKLKQAGFKTTGPTEWKWFTRKVSVLNKLKKLTDIMITELALEKYKNFDQIDKSKTKLKKDFKKQLDLSRQPKADEYIDPKTGITCIRVKMEKKEFVMTYKPPGDTGSFCFVCGDKTYLPEEDDLCLWCSRK